MIKNLETKHGRHSAGKGSIERTTDRQKYEASYDRIFGKKPYNRNKVEEEFDKNVSIVVD
jgi:hypothetical protein